MTALLPESSTNAVPLQSSPPLPPTVAESSAFTRTATSADVLAHIAACVDRSRKLTRLTLGTSTQGKEIPLVLVADPPVASLAAARASGKLAVLVCANIHAGEVEGKEAVQILLRELAEGEDAALLDQLVIALVPNYNPDGNDAIDRKNRPDQNGPIEGVGQRANGQGLDLNRDFMKAEAPETRGLIATVNALDAALVMDLHTTDGSFHGYELTYAGAMHPASDPELLRFTRETFLPALRADMRTRGFETFDYGDFADQAHPEQGWFSFDHRPRFGTNYFGLCNRVALLSEAYSHESFEVRVRATHAFVLSALHYAADHAGALRALRAHADATARALAGTANLVTRGEMETTRERDSVLVGACRREKDAVTSLERVIDTCESQPIEMDIHVSFRGLEPAPVPLAWALPGATPEIEALLRLHGIECRRTTTPEHVAGRSFRISARKEEGRPFQGHQLVDLVGADETFDADVPIDTLIVPTAQPLARLAFTLLEPRSDDGLATWRILGTLPDEDEERGDRFAVIRVDGWRQ